MTRSSLLSLLLAVAYGVSAADFSAGMRAFEAKDYATALNEWLPLAESGEPRSQNNIGSLYYHGLGVPVDHSRACFWYLKAAESALSEGQNNAGYCYLKGDGVDRDYKQAHYWFLLAGPGADEEDRQARAQAEKSLSRPERDDTVRRAKAWQSTHSHAMVHSLAVPNEWRAASAVALAGRRDVIAMPLSARDEILMAIDPSFATQSFASRTDVLALAEQRTIGTLPKYVLWGSKKSCCRSVYRDGYQYLVFDEGTGLYLAFVIAQYSDFMRVWIYADNRATGRNFDIVTDQIRLAQIEPKPIVLSTVDVDEIMRGALKKATWTSLFIQILGSLATTTTTERTSGSASGTYDSVASDGSYSSGTYSGRVSATTTTTRPDYAARDAAMVRAAAIRLAAQEKDRVVHETALRSNTLTPGKQATGFVYFRRKRGALSVLQVRIGGTAYEILIGGDGKG